MFLRIFGFLVLFFVLIIQESYCDDNTKAPKGLKHKGQSVPNNNTQWWSNGEIPFYINRAHFGRDQIEQIQRVLAFLAENTCLNFILSTREDEYKNTMVFQNPNSVRRCIVNKTRHYEDRINYVELGYKCLEKPGIEMKVMQALGFPFEHNRLKRDIYIKEIIYKNIESGFENLFEKDTVYPEVLRSFRYDINSVMHFSDKDFSKNGHSTFVFRNPKMRQSKTSFTELDVKKIKAVYQELCQRRYRSNDVEKAKKMTTAKPKRFKRAAETNLRINRSIKPKSNNETIPITTTTMSIEALIKEINKEIFNKEEENLNLRKSSRGTTNKGSERSKKNKNTTGPAETKNELKKLTREAKKLVDTVIRELELNQTNPELEKVAKIIINQTLPLEKDVEALSKYVKQNSQMRIKRKAKKKSKSKKKKATPRIQNKIKPNSSFEPQTVKLTEDNILFYKDRKWPDGKILYHFDEAESADEIKSLRKRMNDVIDILNDKTCVRMQEIPEDNPDLFKDYLVIDSSDDFITGRTGGRQRFGSKELFDGDQHLQHTAMMVMSMLGFYFETSRHDRDDYVKVHKSNILSGKLHHFDTLGDEATFALPYDYESATHPSWDFWRQRGRSSAATIATLKQWDPDGSKMKSLGQNPNLLSESDIIKINSLYGVSCFKQ